MFPSLFTKEWLEQFALYERAIFFFKNYLGLKFTFFYKDKRELISLFKRATIVNNKRTNHSRHSLQKERKRDLLVFVKNELFGQKTNEGIYYPAV